MTPYILGLDLGSNSVGWAMIARKGKTFDGGRRILAGARVFPEGVDLLNTKREKPRGQERRLARGQRRLHQRRSTRKGALRGILRKAGLLPTDREALSAVLSADPYRLRKRALDEPLTEYEIGRVLVHLCQRRGFKSNRKQRESKDGQVAKETAALQADIEAAGARTLGEYLASLAVEPGDAAPHRSAALERIRDRYTLRSMFEEEFAKVWNTQAAFHPERLTHQLREVVHELIFYQRPITWDQARIGDCELESGEKRCPRAHWLGQQFRILQEINLLKVLDRGGEERLLDGEERKALAEALAPRAKLTFDQIRQLLGFYDSQTFNLESLSKRDCLKGNAIEAALRKKPLGSWYEAAGPQQREALYAGLAEIENDDELRRLARDELGLNDAQTERLIKIKLPPGRFRVSLKAIRKITPHLEAGLIYSDAKAAAGYQLVSAAPTHDVLPPVDDTLENLTNPLVHRALTETRKVVNAIVLEYGKPAEVVIELARDIKNSGRRRREIFFDNLKHRDENEKARTRLLEEFGLPNPSRDDITRFKLWEECDKTCVYTGRTIPKSKLLSGEIQIEHVLPYSRSLDDSYMNKTLCYVDENRRRKGNKTPYEAYHDTTENYEAVLQRGRCLPYPKRRRFTQKDIDLDRFVERQLNDTRYLSRLAVAYLRRLGTAVRSVKGLTTSELRHQWGLDAILSPLAPAQKARDDHRHHAVDAAVIAMTTRSALQKLSTVKYNPVPATLPKPWESFREDLQEVVNEINVSHRPTRKLAGKLHEDTNYGPGSSDRRGVLRVPVAELTWNMVGEIRDRVIREIVRAAVAHAATEKGIQLKGADKVSKVLGDRTLAMASGVPIRKLRIERTENTLVAVAADQDGRPIKLVKPGGNHHLEIYEKPDGTWTGRAVSRFEAHQRLRNGRPVVDRHPPRSLTFLMSFCVNDMACLTDPNTRQTQLYRVQKGSVSPDTGTPDVWFRLHTAARIDDDNTRQRFQSWRTLKQWCPQKVTVDPLGRIHPCND